MWMKIGFWQRMRWFQLWWGCIQVKVLMPGNKQSTYWMRFSIISLVLSWEWCRLKSLYLVFCFKSRVGWCRLQSLYLVFCFQSCLGQCTLQALYRVFYFQSCLGSCTLQSLKSQCSAENDFLLWKSDNCEILLPPCRRMRTRTRGWHSMKCWIIHTFSIVPHMTMRSMRTSMMSLDSQFTWESVSGQLLVMSQLIKLWINIGSSTAKKFNQCRILLLRSSYHNLS